MKNSMTFLSKLYSDYIARKAHTVTKYYYDLVCSMDNTVHCGHNMIKMQITLSVKNLGG